MIDNGQKGHCPVAVYVSDSTPSRCDLIFNPDESFKISFDATQEECRFFFLNWEYINSPQFEENFNFRITVSLLAYLTFTFNAPFALFMNQWKLSRANLQTLGDFADEKFEELWGSEFDNSPSMRAKFESEVLPPFRNELLNFKKSSKGLINEILLKKSPIKKSLSNEKTKKKESERENGVNDEKIENTCTTHLKPIVKTLVI